MDGEPARRVTLEDFSNTATPQFFTSIARPEVQAANISYPHSLIQLIQGNLFHGLPSEDPYAHLASYIEICNTVKIAEVPEDAVRLNLFSFSLAGEAKRWLHSFKGNSLRTWEEVVEKFLKKYFPESKTVEGKMEISSFHQFPDESLSEALDHFHGLLRKTPTHGYNEPVQLNIFIDGLWPQSKQLLDASAGGKIKLKTPEEAMELIENMVANDQAILRDRTYVPTKRSLLELGTQDTTLAQNKLLTRQIEALTETLSKLPQQLQAYTIWAYQIADSRVITRGTHPDSTKGELDSITGHRDSIKEMQGSGWRNQGNQYKEQRNQQPYQLPYQHPSQGPNQQEKPTNIEELLLQFIQETRSHQKSTDAAIRNLEVQMGQLAHDKAERPTRTFGANTEKNPKEECKTETPEERTKEEEKVASPPKTKSQKGREANKEEPLALPQDLPYPVVPTKKNKERYFIRFLEIFKGLEITMPFGEALQQMPLYSKFMKDILTKKGKYIDNENIVVGGNCSAIIQRK
ncbi:uncharacterized protein [Glycine max]|uniref:uncharacterized protein n=1 Tax=Glycine max TaxID=3847 RepID=UPI0003DEC74C|nr:uncharacterized protein LOC100789411 [Glycine max]|eukprot:XP_006586463.1 uncharacterized protein LOC100789411 [Glycine max]